MDAREGLINSRFHSNSCFSNDTQVNFGRYPLIRGLIHTVRFSRAPLRETLKRNES